MYYYTDITGLRSEDYEAAGNKAAVEHNDTWFACDVKAATGQTEEGTVFTESNGVIYEVWLERTYRAAYFA